MKIPLPKCNEIDVPNSDNIDLIVKLIKEKCNFHIF